MDIPDHFSQQAAQYSRFRPTYPAALFSYILAHCTHRGRVWDCATGNGQAATILAEYFNEVEATDRSPSQLSHATHLPHINYTLSPAESTTFPDDHFDLITVAQALHWLDTDAFWQEVRRVGKKGGTVACWGYGMFRTSPAIDLVLDRCYTEILGPYWPPRRRHIETAYQNIPFPFEKIPDPNLSIELSWDLEMTLAYFGTWSATRRYINDRNADPIPLVREALLTVWGDPKEEKTVRWPLFLLMGQL